MLQFLLPLATITSSISFQADQAPDQGQFAGRQGGRRRQGGFPGAQAGAPGAQPGAATPEPQRTGPPLENIPWVRTHHSTTVQGVKIDYTATCGWLPIRDGNGEVTGNMFFVEYSKDGADPKTRPVIFGFNGGPGSSSMWLHMGAIGPYRAHMNDDGSMPAPPFDYVKNEQTFLPATDIVMLDAMGTGYSRTTNPTDRSFYGVRGDIEGFTDAIKEFLNREKRWRSPKFVIGESYGGMRVAGLSDGLLEAGIAVNGIISLSGVMNDATLDGGRFNDLPYYSYLPSEAAVAWFHKRLAPKYEAMKVGDLCRLVEKFTTGEYTQALDAGNELSDAERQTVAGKLAEYTGIPKTYYMQSNLRIRAQSFMAELLHDKMESVGRYDGRLIGRETDGTTGRPDYDASDAAVSPVFTAAVNEYFDEELKFHPSDYRLNLDYRGTAYQYIGGWDYGIRQGYADTSQDLQRCLDQNPTMKVMLCCGRFDLACPYMGMRYTMAHLGEAPELAKNIHFEYYPAGHMMYIDTPAREKLQKDVEAFIASAVPH